MMYLIDEKGKIFGKFNIIDLSLIIFTILVIITAYKYLYLKNYPENILDKLAVNSKSVWINVTAFSFLSETVLNNVKVGDVSKSKDFLKNETIGKILKIEFEKKDKNKMKSRITYSLLVSKNTNELIYNDKRLLLGQDLIFDTELYSLDGEIVNIER